MQQEEKIMKEAVLCLLRRGREVLLAKKTRKIGMGKWNGYGGGIDAGESIRDAAVRELFEESGCSADPAMLEKVAVVDFENTLREGGTFTVKVHIFFVWEWEGTPRASAEMDTPTWFPVDALPYADMMPGDEPWISAVLAGKKVTAFEIGRAHV